MYMKGQTSRKKSRIQKSHTRKQRGGASARKSRPAMGPGSESGSGGVAYNTPQPRRKRKGEIGPVLISGNDIHVNYNPRPIKRTYSDINKNHTGDGLASEKKPQGRSEMVFTTPSVHSINQILSTPQAASVLPPLGTQHARTQHRRAESGPVQSMNNNDTTEINFETINYNEVDDDIALHIISEEAFVASQLRVRGNLSYLILHAIKGLIDAIFDFSNDYDILEDNDLNNLYIYTEKQEKKLDAIFKDEQYGGAMAEDTDNEQDACPGLKSIITQGITNDDNNMTLNEYLDIQKLYKDFSHDFGSRLDEDTQIGIKNVYLNLINEIDKSYQKCEPLQCFKSNVTSSKSSEWTYYQSMLVLLTHEDSSLYDNLKIFKTVDITQDEESNAKISEIKQILINNFVQLRDGGYVQELYKLNNNETNTNERKTYFMCDAYGNPIRENHTFLNNSTMGTIMPDNSIRAYLLQPLITQDVGNVKEFLTNKFIRDSKITMAGLADPATIGQVPVGKTLQDDIYGSEREFLKTIFNNFLKLYGVIGEIIQDVNYIPNKPNPTSFIGIQFSTAENNTFDLIIGDTTIENITRAVENRSDNITTPGGRVNVLANYILSKIPTPIEHSDYTRKAIMVGLKAFGDFSQVRLIKYLNMNIDGLKGTITTTDKFTVIQSIKDQVPFIAVGVGVRYPDDRIHTASRTISEFERVSNLKLSNENSDDNCLSTCPVIMTNIESQDAGAIEADIEYLVGLCNEYSETSNIVEILNESTNETNYGINEVRQYLSETTVQTQRDIEGLKVVRSTLKKIVDVLILGTPSGYKSLEDSVDSMIDNAQQLFIRKIEKIKTKQNTFHSMRGIDLLSDENITPKKINERTNEINRIIDVPHKISESYLKGEIKARIQSNLTKLKEKINVSIFDRVRILIESVQLPVQKRGSVREQRIRAAENVVIDNGRLEESTEPLKQALQELRKFDIELHEKIRTKENDIEMLSNNNTSPNERKKRKKELKKDIKDIKKRLKEINQKIKRNEYNMIKIRKEHYKRVTKETERLRMTREPPLRIFERIKIKLSPLLNQRQSSTTVQSLPLPANHTSSSNNILLPIPPTRGQAAEMF
jgi:hypothetical protein